MPSLTFTITCCHHRYLRRITNVYFKDVRAAEKLEKYKSQNIERRFCFEYPLPLQEMGSSFSSVDIFDIDVKYVSNNGWLNDSVLQMGMIDTFYGCEPYVGCVEVNMLGSYQLSNNLKIELHVQMLERTVTFFPTNYDDQHWYAILYTF